MNFAQYAAVYLKGTISGNIFTLTATNYLTCTIPTTADNYFYIPLGIFYNSTTNIYFNSSKDLYAFVGGSFQLVANFATRYITHVDDNGVSIHPKSTTANRLLINANGTEVFKGNTSVAFYGDTARIGKMGSGNKNIYINPEGIYMRNDASVLANFWSTGLYLWDSNSYALASYGNEARFYRENLDVVINDIGISFSGEPLHLHLDDIEDGSVSQDTYASLGENEGWLHYDTTNSQFNIGSNCYPIKIQSFGSAMLSETENGSQDWKRIFSEGYLDVSKTTNGALPISHGGTGKTSAADARTALGVLGTEGGTVTGTLILSKTTDASGTANNSPALIVGGTATQAHLEFDANEIMAKGSGTTTAKLNINGDGGEVEIGDWDGNHIYFDANYIQARNNTAAQSLYINSNGGEVICGGKITASRAEFTSTTDSVITSNATVALSIGTATGRHLEIDPYRIQGKSNATTAAPLYLNQRGGQVYVGDPNGDHLLFNTVGISRYNNSSTQNVLYLNPGSTIAVGGWYSDARVTISNNTISANKANSGDLSTLTIAGSSIKVKIGSNTYTLQPIYNYYRTFSVGGTTVSDHMTNTSSTTPSGWTSEGVLGYVFR